MNHFIYQQIIVGLILSTVKVHSLAHLKSKQNFQNVIYLYFYFTNNGNNHLS